MMKKDKYNKLIFGVCGGIAKYSIYDVFLIRLFFLAAAVLSLGLACLVYLFLAAVMPDE